MFWLAGEHVAVAPYRTATVIDDRSVYHEFPPPAAVADPVLCLWEQLRPGWTAAVLGVPAIHLRDVHVPFSDLHGSPAARAPAADPVVLAALRVIGREPGRPVAGVAAALGVSSRHLHRRFCAAVGYGPKLFRRVLRLQRLLAAASGKVEIRPLGALAADLGYADQAHLCRDVRVLAGHAPRDLVGRRASTLAMSDLINAGGGRPG